ncbi:MAG: P27 family phage terminase small subunit [Planctomycetaceae bacterium]|nr:P27 family phage terminase small subunit [Planctomycetaceae bacterium]
MVGVPGRSGGRNRKTTAEHKLNGSYHPDRHGGRIDGADAAGDPRKPDDLSPLQSSLWDAIVDHLPDGVVGVLDSASLTALVRRYVISADLTSRVEQNLGDTKLMSQATKAWDRFDQLGQDYGLTPNARAQLGAVPSATNDEPDPFKELLLRQGWDSAYFASIG